MHNNPLFLYRVLKWVRFSLASSDIVFQADVWHKGPQHAASSRNYECAFEQFANQQQSQTKRLLGETAPWCGLDASISVKYTPSVSFVWPKTLRITTPDYYENGRSKDFRMLIPQKTEKRGNKAMDRKEVCCRKHGGRNRRENNEKIKNKNNKEMQEQLSITIYGGCTERHVYRYIQNHQKKERNGLKRSNRDTRSGKHTTHNKHTHARTQTKRKKETFMQVGS